MWVYIQIDSNSFQVLLPPPYKEVGFWLPGWVPLLGPTLQVLGGAGGKHSGHAQHDQSLRKKTEHQPHCRGGQRGGSGRTAVRGTWQMWEPGVLFGCFHKYEDLGRGKHSRLDLGDPVVGGRA